jgi:TPR repeat protein
MYQYGAGVTKDSIRAAFWYRKAAENGDINAQKKLDEMEKR